MAKPSKVADDPPQPARTTRQTRSRSVEPTAQLGRSPNGKPARATRNSKSAIASTAPAKRATRSKTAEPPELDTVEEDADLDQAQLDAQLTQDQAEQAENELDDDDRRRRISGGNVSVISGTTAKTSFSQEEVETMDHEVMLDVLPGLLTACDELSRLIIPQGGNTPTETWKEIRRSGSRHTKLYNNRISTINVHKPNFGSQEYISPRHVLKALLGVNDVTGIPAASWRPDPLVYKINLIQMLNSVLVTCDPAAWTDECTYALERLHSAFWETIAGSEFSYPTLEFYLLLSAHFTIAQLDSHIYSEPHFEPHAIIESQFIDDDGNLIHESSLGLANASDEEQDEARTRIQDLVGNLQGYFKTNNAVNARAANNRLKANWQWDELRSQAIEYADARMQVLNERIERAGGTQQILLDLGAEIQRRVNEKDAQALRQRLGKGSKNRKSFGGVASLAKLREKERQVEAAPSSAPAPAAQKPAAHATQVAAVAALQAQPSNSAPHRSLQADVADFASSTAQAKRNGKQKARWTDPQPTAQRVSPIAESPRQTQNARSLLSAPTSSRLGKRGFDEMEEDQGVPDPTQDEGFQVDNRDFASADERRRQVNFPRPARPQPPPQSSPRAEASGSTAQIPRPSFGRPSVEPRPSPSKRQRTNPGSAIPDIPPPPGVDDGDLPPEATWERAKTLAKINRLTAAADRQPRGRVHWEDDEEEALIRLIVEHGTGGISWAGLKKIDQADENVLASRNAEDIRFKARNMKVSYLLADNSLPPNWEHVNLAKKEIDKLNSRGVRYDQAPLRRRDHAEA